MLNTCCLVEKFGGSRVCYFSLTIRPRSIYSSNYLTFRVTKGGPLEIVAIIWCGKIIVPFEEYIPLIRPEYNCMPGKFESLVWDLNMNKLKSSFQPRWLACTSACQRFYCFHTIFMQQLKMHECVLQRRRSAILKLEVCIRHDQT